MSRVVNGVDISFAPSFPANNRCPECGEPIRDIRVAALTTRLDSQRAQMEAVSPPEVEGPYFMPCRHDARSCFPRV